jgi:hypothetical protein
LGALIPDNGYLLVGIQVGLFGALAFFGAVTVLVVDLWRRRLAPALAGSSLLMVFLVSLVFGGFVNLLGPMTVLAVSVALLAGGVGDTVPIDWRERSAAADPLSGRFHEPWVLGPVLVQDGAKAQASRPR